MKTFSGVLELTEALAKKRGITKKKAHSIVRDLLECMEEELLREESLGLQIVNFITLTKVVRKAKLGRNPNNPTEEYHIPERNGIRLLIGKEFNEKYSKIKVD